MLLTFAYAMVNYYDTSIPGLGFSIKGFIDGGTINLVNLIGSDGSTTMLNEIHAASSKTGPSMLTSMMSPYYSLVFFAVQFLLALLAAIVSAILAYGAIAATIIGLLGPIFIPFLVFDKLDWLFWGWLKAYLGFSFYKVVAAATMNVLSHVLTNYYLQLGQSVSDPSLMVQTLPLACSSGAGQRLHPFQDSDHDAQPIHWRYWRPRWGLGRGDDGDTGGNVIALARRRESEDRDERRNDEHRNESQPRKSLAPRNVTWSNTAIRWS